MFSTYKSLDPVPVMKPEEIHLNPARKHQGIPGITRIASGRLFAVWYAGGTTECELNYVLLSVSDDDGKSWTDAVAVVDPPENIRAFDSTIWVAPDGRFFWFWTQGNGGKDGAWDTSDGIHGVWYAILENPDSPNPEDFKFTQPVRIANGVMMNKPCVLSDGTWALPVSVWSNKAMLENIRFHTSLNVRPGCKIIVSQDSGKTFQERGSISLQNVPGGPSFDEHSFLEMKDGTIRVFIRIADGTADSYSYDKGKTWTAPILLNTIQTPSSRCFVFRLASGRVLFLGNHSDPACPQVRKNLTAFLSEDDGRTWTHSILIDEREQTSYPDAVEDEKGNIYIVYDRERQKRGEILLARITEEDIIAGKIVSPTSFLRREIDHTNGI